MRRDLLRPYTSGSPTGCFWKFCQSSVDCMSTGLFLDCSMALVSVFNFEPTHSYLQTDRLESKSYDVSSFVFPHKIVFGSFGGLIWFLMNFTDWLYFSAKNVQWGFDGGVLDNRPIQRPLWWWLCSVLLIFKNDTKNKCCNVYFDQTKFKSCAVIITNLSYYTCVPGKAFSSQVYICGTFICFYI